MTTAVQLDHIIILLPLEQLRNLPSWITDNFTIAPGGVHADGVTENSLILFADGVYIELIAFTEHSTPEQRAKHRWGDKPFGVVDYAFTLSTTDNQKGLEELQQRWKDGGVKGELIAPKLVPGGRNRPDGVKLEWQIASAAERGVVNFWCLDVTPRNRRVPLSEELSRHASGATGVASVSLYADERAQSDLGAYFKATLVDGDGRYFSIASPHGEDSTIVVTGPRTGEKKVDIRIALRTPGRESGKIGGELGGSQVEFELVQ